MRERTFDYSIDRDDVLGCVSESWLDFARENRAAELTRESVLGRPIWSFVAGDETRRLYQALFDRVRSGRESIEIPFRCDSPDRFRFMRLTLGPGSGDGIEFRSVLVREQERPFFSILEKAFPRTKGRLRMCSLCKRIFAFDLRWLELEAAIHELDLFDSAHLPELEYVVCDECPRTREEPAA